MSNRSSTPIESTPASSALGLSGHVDPPPEQGAPAVRAGYVRQTTGTGRRLSPKIAQTESANAAADEIIGSYALYLELFKHLAPDGKELAAKLKGAAKWSHHVRVGEAWLSYAKDQRHLAWRDVMPRVRALNPVLSAAAENPEVAARFPSLLRFLKAPSEVAIRAVATKKGLVPGVDGIPRAERAKVLRARKREQAALAKAEAAKLRRMETETEARAHASAPAPGHGPSAGTPAVK